MITTTLQSIKGCAKGAVLYIGLFCEMRSLCSLSKHLFMLSGPRKFLRMKKGNILILIKFGPKALSNFSFSLIN